MLLSFFPSKDENPGIPMMTDSFQRFSTFVAPMVTGMNDGEVGQGDRRISRPSMAQSVAKRDPPPTIRGWSTVYGLALLHKIPRQKSHTRAWSRTKILFRKGYAERR